ncbi:hypothetical protein CYMTET_31430 [Cymbomonas tetramitiformis]|uniref:Uncharacterized protein n=1 Tax=Cymbomonas tetramitiformis TaxID=36881 RepID=A0AAE0FGZ6_9CHLO|nr:hypothetical protein CYMTET_31430 [Cymbomonas tetramitiformis]
MILMGLFATAQPVQNELQASETEVSLLPQQFSPHAKTPLTFGLFFTGDASGKHGKMILKVVENIRKHHKSLERFPIVLLTDETTMVLEIPDKMGVEIRRQPSVPGARYLNRARAERSVLEEALTKNRPTHAVFLDATDIIVQRSLLPLFSEQTDCLLHVVVRAGCLPKNRSHFSLALTYRPPQGKERPGRLRGALSINQPINLGVKAVHGGMLPSGIEAYTAFVETYKRNYLDRNRTFGLLEQSAIVDVLKRSSNFSMGSLLKNNKKWWKVPIKDVNGIIAAPPENNKDYIRCQKQHYTEPHHKVECKHLQVQYAKVRMLNCQEWNCLRPFAPSACKESRILHFKGNQKRKMIKWLEEQDKAKDLPTATGIDKKLTDSNEKKQKSRN